MSAELRDAIAALRTSIDDADIAGAGRTALALRWGLAKLEDQAAKASPGEEVERLRGAVDDGVATLAAIRASSSGSLWHDSAAHFHELCGSTMRRMNAAKASPEKEAGR